MDLAALGEVYNVFTYEDKLDCENYRTPGQFSATAVIEDNYSEDHKTVLIASLEWHLLT